MSFNPGLIEQMKREVYGSSYRLRNVMAGRWAEMLGISKQQVYRIIKNGNAKKRASLPIKPEYHNWTDIIFQIKKRPPEEAGEISTEDAVAIAVRDRLILEDALDVPVGTFNSIGRKKGLHKKKQRRNRFQADRPNRAHHFDASTSKFLYVARRLEGDEYILKIHRPAKHYKNKPVPVRLRPWVYGLVDDYSGRHIARYTVAEGENSIDSMSFLAYAWSDIGLPVKLLADQGMLKKALPSKDLIERLGVELPEMMPYQKEGHGKIERPWRTFWKKFEALYFAVDNWQKFEITLTELNAQLQNFINDKYNHMPHRFERGITRMQAWKRINLHGGIVKIPENALKTVAKRKKRKVGVDGLLIYEGGTYEVKGLHDAWVHVFEGVFDGRLVVQEIETGSKFEVKDFKPLGIDEYRAHPETPHQKAVKAAQYLNISSVLYGEKNMAPEKVLEMPIRTKEEREVQDPLDVTMYPSLQGAMRDFFEIVGVFIHQDQREVIEKTIQENGLKKDFVREIALEIRAAIEQRRVAAG